MRRVRVFLLGAVALTVTSLLINSIGVWFSLYLSQRLGAEVMGVFQLMMSVYAFGITLATSGINLAATRLVAEELGRPGPARVRLIMHRCLGYSLCFGTAAAAALCLGARQIGTVWLGHAETVLPLRVMAVSLPFLSMSSALSGYFTAVRRVARSASVQIAEQLLKVGLTVAGLSCFGGGLQSACLCIIGAGVAAEGFSFTVSLLLYRFDAANRRSSRRETRGITRELLGIALPVALSAYLRSGLLTLKNLLVPVRLQRGGVSSTDSLAAFGTIHGVALPVVLFPSALLTSFANLIVPELAECRARGGRVTESRQIHYMMRRMFQVTLLFSIGTAGVLFCFASPVAALVGNNPTAEGFIRLFAPLVPIMYVDTVVDSMLKGLGEQVSSMRFNIIDAAVSLALVWTLLPVWGIRGYVAVIFVSEVLNFALSLHRLLAVTGYRCSLCNDVFKPALCIAVATLFARLLPHSTLPLLGENGHAVLAIVASVLFYLLLLCLSGSLTREDRRWLCGVLQQG